jgi:tetrahydromethanopterin S-methyltransferase subunit B
MTDIEILLERIKKLEKRVARLESNAAPTVPIYDATNFPQDAIEGQIVIATS